MGEVKQISYQLGAAQTRVAQLEEPKVSRDPSRQVATEVGALPTAETAFPSPAPAADEPSIQILVSSVTEQKKKSTWQKIFG
jgi:hypothetical protein